DARSRLGAHHPTASSERISWSSACFAPGLFADDAFAGRAFEARLDRYGTKCVQGSRVTRFPVANARVRDQFAIVALPDWLAGNRKDGGIRAHECGVVRFDLDPACDRSR